MYENKNEPKFVNGKRKVITGTKKSLTGTYILRCIFFALAYSQAQQHMSTLVNTLMKLFLLHIQPLGWCKYFYGFKWVAWLHNLHDTPNYNYFEKCLLVFEIYLIHPRCVSWISTQLLVFNSKIDHILFTPCQ